MQARDDARDDRHFTGVSSAPPSRVAVQSPGETFRSEQFRLTGSFKGNAINEYLAFYEIGVDGLFSDFADTAFAARAMFLLKHDRHFAACLVSGRHCRHAED